MEIPDGWEFCPQARRINRGGDRQANAAREIYSLLRPSSIGAVEHIGTVEHAATATARPPRVACRVMYQGR